MSENYMTDTGQLINNVHDRRDCQGPWCVIHNPAPGPWAQWPTFWLQFPLAPGVNGCLTRICPHGVAHPCAEDNTPTVLVPHHADCDGCPCSPQYIGSTAQGVAQAKMVLGMEQAPVDYSGNPARLKSEMTAAEIFKSDQDAAAVEEALGFMINTLVSSVIASGGHHGGRHAVSGSWLEAIAGFDDVEIKALLQYACWYLAEGALRSMERDGTLMNVYGVKLGEGWDDPV